MKKTKNKKLIINITLICCAILFATVIGFTTWWLLQKHRPQTIPVGILHSLTGTMAISEKNVVDAVQLAITEINQLGGVLGKKIVPIVADGQSDWQTFAKEAERLITKEKVAAIFGCWTSASRKTVKPVIEKHKNLLFYPVQYEGLEQSPHIVYTGAAPNQQIIPAVNWCFDNLGKTFFLVGSDYVFPRTAHEIIKYVVTQRGGTIVGENYLLLGSNEVRTIIDLIIKTKPDVILNTINGDSNIHFFRALRAAGITPEKIPVMSFSIAEPELAHLGVESMIGDYAAWNYFQSITTETNKTFVQKFKEKYGINRVISDPMEAAYFGVHLWARAAELAQSTEPENVLRALNNLAFNAPQGVIHIDPETHHTWKLVRIGKIRSDGQFTIVWDSEKTVQPVPYPLYKEKKEWNTFLQTLYEQWGQKWAKPATA